MKTKNFITAALAMGLTYFAAQATAQTRKGMGVIPAKKEAVQPLVIFPNPAKDQVQINLNGTKEEEFKLQVLNSQGSIVIEKKWRGEKLDVSALVPGSYVVTLRRDKLVYSEKLAIIK